MGVMEPARILVMAGGTGGHVYPALAVADELRRRGHHIHWVGTARGLEARVVPAAGFPLHELSVRGLRGKGPLQLVMGLWALLTAFFGALRLVWQQAPGCILGMGGYVAGPAGLAGFLLRKPLVLHEQNAVAGTTNRLLAPLATRIAAAFPGAFGAREVIEVGNPVRASLVEQGAAAHWDYDGGRPLRLLVLGGSLGAKPLNDLLPEALRLLQQEQRAPEVWHQCGDKHFSDVRSAYAEQRVRHVRLSPFIEDMAEAYAWADLVFCRSGALTVSELAIMGRPSVLVPLPHAIDDHQTANARYLSDAGAALLMPQSTLTPQVLADTVAELAAAPDRLREMAAAARGRARPEAAARVADLCEEVLRGRD